MASTSQWLALASRDVDYVTYQLSIVLSRAQTLQVGRLGRCRFPAGRYVYTGSARKNLIPRVQRHLRKKKKLRWHIDYLLSNPSARVVEVALSKTSECMINQQVKGEVLMTGFGASDCRAHCGSHLKYLGE